MMVNPLVGLSAQKMSNENINAHEGGQQRTSGVLVWIII